MDDEKIAKRVLARVRRQQSDFAMATRLAAKADKETVPFDWLKFKADVEKAKKQVGLKEKYDYFIISIIATSDDTDRNRPMLSMIVGPFSTLKTLEDCDRFKKSMDKVLVDIKKVIDIIKKEYPNVGFKKAY